MYQKLQLRLSARIREFLREKYGIDLGDIGVDQPPKVELGEYALTFCFELAKRLKKAPRAIATEIVAEIGAIPGFEKLEVAGGGYINARVNRAEMAKEILEQSHPSLREGWGTQERASINGLFKMTGERGASAEGREQGARGQQPERSEGVAGPSKILVEHTSINPNKAAHIGHLRNAILGDTFVRLLREAGNQVDVQNYIDNTGVQVADVVVGLTHIERKTKAEVRRIIDDASARGGLSIDYFCWDLYARVAQWYEQSPENKAVRLKTLHEIEHGGNDAAEIAEMVSTAVLRRHLETMERLDIEYDFLPRESEILSLKFWDAAFELMKQKGVLYLEQEGKNKGCWVMKRASASKKAEAATPEAVQEPTGPDEDAKVIVRSNGTVTYVGKDIAYHLWKFGLLGKDFGYRKFFQYPNEHKCWISTTNGEQEHPHFGGVSAIYNVIDSRQADPQNNVIEALRAMGYTEAAEHYTHFSYEMVALTPRCAAELGYEVSDEDKERSYIEVSGRKGFGVKADDLLDALISAAQKEVDGRHPELSEAERRRTAEQIAIGALRYFMLKFTKNSVIAFDFKDALSFEGETGPYCQYAVVRAGNIFRKAGVSEEATLAGGLAPAAQFAEDDIWELWLAASKLSYVVDQCIATTEPAYLAKYAFQLAQGFNNFYHRHHILNEPDEARKRFLLATVAVARREMVRALDVMGVRVPDVM